MGIDNETIMLGLNETYSAKDVYLIEIMSEKMF